MKKLGLFPLVGIVCTCAGNLFAQETPPEGEVWPIGNALEMNQAASWNPAIAITAAEAANYDYVVSGMETKTPNNVSVAALSRSLSITNGSLAIVRNHASGYSKRTYSFPGLSLADSKLALRGDIGGNDNDIVTPVTFLGNCFITRESGGYDHRLLFTSTSGISGSGTLSIQNNAGSALTITTSAVGNYAGAIRLLNARNNNSTFTFNQPIGPASLFVGGSSGIWTIYAASETLTPLTGITVERANTAFVLSGSNTLPPFSNTATTTFRGGGTLTLPPETDTTFSNATFSGTLALVKTGSSTATFAANNTFSGGFTINEGSVVFSTASSMGGGPLTINGGEVDLTACAGSSAVSALNFNTGTIKMKPGKLLFTISGGVSFGEEGAEMICDLTGVSNVSARYVLAEAKGGFTGNPAGVAVSILADEGLSLTGELGVEGNQLTLFVTGAQRELQWNAASGSWSTSSADTPWLPRGSSIPTAFTDGALVTFPDIAEETAVLVTPVDSLAPGGMIFNNTESDYTVAAGAELAVAGDVVKKGSGSATIESPASISGSLDVQAGVLTFSTFPAVFSNPIRVMEGASLTIAAEGDITLSGAITGGGTIINAGTGTLTVTGNFDANLSWQSDSAIRFNLASGSKTIAGSFSGGGALIKAGAGALTVMSKGYAATGPFNVEAGTLFFSTADRGFNVFQFDVTKVRFNGDSKGGFGISELQLMLGDSVVNWPSGTSHTVAVAAGAPAKCYDNVTGKADNAEKWYDGSAVASNASSGNITRRNAITLTTPVPILVNGHRIWGTDRQSRDPVSWIFKAGLKAADGSITWLTTDTVTDSPMPTYANEKGWSVYSDTFPISQDDAISSFKDLHFSVAPGATLDLTAAFGIFGSISGEGTVKIAECANALGVTDFSAFSGTLTGMGTFDIQSEEAQTVSFRTQGKPTLTASRAQVTLLLSDGASWMTTLSGNIRVLKTGEGSAMINSSTPSSHTGGTVVEQGALRVCGLYTARYFKFVITDTRQPTNDNHVYCSGTQLSELQPMLDGARIVPDGWSVEVTPNSSNIPNLTDGDTTTKGALDKGAANGSAYILIDFGKVIPFDGYCWYTANDCPFRDPVGWRVEISDDKTTWRTIDTHTREENLVEPVNWTDHTDLGSSAFRFAQIGPFQLAGDTAQVLPAQGEVTIAQGAELICEAAQNMGAVSGEGTLVLPGLVPETTVQSLSIGAIRFLAWPEELDQTTVYPVFSYTENCEKSNLLNAANGWVISPNGLTKTLNLVYRNGLKILLY